MQHARNVTPPEAVWINPPPKENIGV